MEKIILKQLKSNLQREIKNLKKEMKSAQDNNQLNHFSAIYTKGMLEAYNRTIDELNQYLKK